MELPDNWKQFKSLVLEKIRIYCAAKIWPFEFNRFAAWLGNFEDEKDEYVALHILDSLIVRSYPMVVAGYARFLACDLRQALIGERVIDSDISIQSWIKFLKAGDVKRSKTIFVPVTTGDSLAESGGAIARVLSGVLNTDKLCMPISKASDKVIVLFDDFAGSGDQFSSYAEQVNLNRILQNNIVFYSPFMAYHDGMGKIEKQYSSLHVLPIETLDESHGIFFHGEKDGRFRNDSVNTVCDVKRHYEAMQDKYIPKMPFWLGRDETSLSLAFEWGCPNQTLSVLWAANSQSKSDWQKLFARRA